MKWLAVFVVRLSPRDGNLHQFTVCQKSEGVPRWKCNSTVPKGGWNFLLHMWLECVCSLQRGIWPLKTDRLLHHQPPAARATLRLLKALCCDCSEASSLVPHLLSLPSNLCQPKAPGSTPVLIFSWPSGFLVYLASDEQLPLSNSSLNLAQPGPPTQLNCDMIRGQTLAPAVCVESWPHFLTPLWWNAGSFLIYAKTSKTKQCGTT